MLNHIQARYKTARIGGREFSLIHKTMEKQPIHEAAAKKKTGLLDLFRPSIASMGKQISDKISEGFKSRAAEKEKNLRASMDRELSRQAAVIRNFGEKHSREQKTHFVKTDKRLDMVHREASLRGEALWKEFNRLAREKERLRREQEAVPKEQQSAKLKDVRAIISKNLSSASRELDEKIYINSRKSVESAVRLVQEKEAYMEKRRAPGRKTWQQHRL